MAAVGRNLERTRFLSTDGAVRARDHALSSLGVVLNEEDDDEDLLGSDESLAFCRTPEKLVTLSVWKLVSDRPWSYTEDIIILQTRPLLFAVNDASSLTSAFLRRQFWAGFGCRDSFVLLVVSRKMFACAVRTGHWLTFRCRTLSSPPQRMSNPST